MRDRLKKLVAFAPAVVIATAVPFAMGVPIVSAATITVTSTSGGTGGPDCTLRDAITAANTDIATGGCAAGSGADTIELAPGATYTFTTALPSVISTSALPDITSEVTINGNGAIVERSTVAGTPDFRILAVSGGSVILNNLTISNGLLSGTVGGGLMLFAGALTLDTVTVANNHNSGNGGAIYSQAVLTISRSTITGNTAFLGAGIATAAGTTIIQSSTFSANAASFQGGGLYASGVATTIENSTFSGNSAASNGGAIAVAVQLTLNNSTVTANSALAGAGLLISGPTLVHNTVIAAQLSGSDCQMTTPTTLEPSNIDSTGTCPAATTVVNPLLGPLTNNGGPTLTHAILPSSPLIDQGTAPCPATDQRGTGRPLGFGCDVGAFEFTPGISTTVVTAASVAYDGSPHGGAALVTGDYGLSQTLPVTYSGRNTTTYGPSSTPPTNAGEYTASATYPGGPNNAPSTGSADYSITIASQQITFTIPPPTDVVLGNPPVTVAATATSGLSVTLAAGGACSGSGSGSMLVSFTSSGTCTVTATQPGDGNWSAAPPAVASTEVAPDADGDGVADADDNCADDANSVQIDTDLDGAGDACDSDDDGDGVDDVEDAFPLDENESLDTDSDGTGNNADTNDDGDAQSDRDEIACGSNPFDPASLSLDSDADTIPDCVDSSPLPPTTTTTTPTTTTTTTPTGVLPPTGTSNDSTLRLALALVAAGLVLAVFARRRFAR